MFEAIVNNKILSFCIRNDIIPDKQFGFKFQHSTVHAIHKLLSGINNTIGKNQLVGGALLDLEKAFDSVWLNGLLYKLTQKNFPIWLVYTIWDMISDKTFVTWDGNNYSSEVFRIREGLQQGTDNRSPVLFNIFTSDILNLFNINCGGNLSALAFADDLIVYV